jgi:RNA polymerase sigma factor (sigma-70 family)
MAQARLEDLLRECAPQVLGMLARRHGQFDVCEDAVQEALTAAVVQWPQTGIPEQPRAWLLTVATTRWLVDHWRSDSARRRREEAIAALELVADDDPASALPLYDDTLTLLVLCCHPALSPESQVALTLRAVGGLTTAEIAAAFLVPESTMAKRISRAKHAIRAAGARFEPPPAHQRAGRIALVLRVLYLIFNEGYTASAGPSLHRTNLTAEAIRLARLLRAILPDNGEVAGLLALMLLTDARRAARTERDGSLVPLDEQRRDLWDTAAIVEGLALLQRTLGTTTVGPYQVQAAIAAVHDEATTADQTDWPQIVALCEVLDTIAPGPAGAMLCLIGAYRLAGELSAAAGDHRVAFRRYEEGHLEMVERSLSQLFIGLVVPKSRAGIWTRNTMARLPLLGAMAGLERRLQPKTEPLPDYGRERDAAEA